MVGREKKKIGKKGIRGRDKGKERKKLRKRENVEEKRKREKEEAESRRMEEFGKGGDREVKRK